MVLSVLSGYTRGRDAHSSVCFVALMSRTAVINSLRDHQDAAEPHTRHQTLGKVSSGTVINQADVDICYEDARPVLHFRTGSLESNYLSNRLEAQIAHGVRVRVHGPMERRMITNHDARLPVRTAVVVL